MQLRLTAMAALGACLLFPLSARAQDEPLAPLPADGTSADPAPTPTAPSSDDPASHPGVVVMRSPNVVIIEMPPAAPSAPVVETAPTAAPEKATQHENWYGGQTLLVDGAATAAMIGGAATVSKSSAGGFFLVTGAVTYLFGAPIVHFAHERIGPGFGSFALRLALPLEVAFDGALIGAALSKPDRYGDSTGEGAAVGAAIGFFGGMAGAIIIDAALLAHEKVDDKDPEAYDPKTDGNAKSPRKEGKSRSPLHIDWAPTAGPVAGGATVGVAGSF